MVSLFKRVIIFVMLSGVIFVLTPLTTFAQEEQLSGTVAQNLQVAESVEGGDIVSLTTEGIKKSTVDYDSQMIGVVVEFPVIAVGEKTNSTASILSSGRSLVKVTNAGGAISKGDFITSSYQAGVGQKASASGLVLGRALEPYDSADVGTISVMVDITNAGIAPSFPGIMGRILFALITGLTNTANFPEVLRYIAATIIGIVTFVLASVSFVRFMRAGLEALGRNPLARGTIVAGMLLNAAMVFGLTLSGFGIAVAIIAL